MGGGRGVCGVGCGRAASRPGTLPGCRLTCIAQRHLLAQVDAQLVVVRRVESRDAPDTLRSEARARAVRGAAVVRHAHHRRVKGAYLPYVLKIRRLHEGVDARVMGQLTARKGGDVAIHDAVGRFQAQALGLIHLLLPSGEGQTLLFLKGRHPLTGMAALEAPGGATGRRHCRGVRVSAVSQAFVPPMNRKSWLETVGSLTQTGWWKRWFPQTAYPISARDRPQWGNRRYLFFSV